MKRGYMRPSQLKRMLLFQGGLVVEKNMPESRMMKEMREGKFDGRLKEEISVRNMLLEVERKCNTDSLVDEEEGDDEVEDANV